MAQKRICIIGGGFAGVRCALDLSLSLPNAQITLLNDTPYHSFHADLYEIAGAILSHERKLDFRNLRGTVNIPLKRIFKNTRVRIVIQTVTAVELTQKIVKTSLDTYPYDYLVLATGSVASYLHVQGAETFGHPFKTTGDALNIRNEIEELVITKNDAQSIVIAGGGFTGVELAGTLMHLLQTLAHHYAKPMSTITLIGSRASVLDGMPEWAQQAAEKRLRDIGVKLLLSHRVAAIDTTTIACDDGTAIPYDYVIWTTGIQGNSLNGAIQGVETTSRGQLTPAQDLRLPQYPDVFVIGDVAECMDQEHGCPVASTAVSAIDQGELAAENITHLCHHESTRAYVSKRTHFVVPIGRKYAISDMNNRRLSGIHGWITKRLFSLKYFRSILPTLDAFHLWWHGVTLYRAND